MILFTLKKFTLSSSIADEEIIHLEIFCLKRSLNRILNVVYWPSTRPNMPFQSDALEGSDTFRWQLWEEIAEAGLTEIWDKVKSHGTLIDWCTGREWPLNCMTVISAWWRSNMPFQRLSGRLNYYITRWDRKSDELEIRRVGDQMS